MRRADPRPERLDLGLRGASSTTPGAGRRTISFVPRYYEIEQELRTRIAALEQQSRCRRTRSSARGSASPDDRAERRPTARPGGAVTASRPRHLRRGREVAPSCRQARRLLGRFAGAAAGRLLAARAAPPRGDRARAAAAVAAGRREGRRRPPRPPGRRRADRVEQAVLPDSASEAVPSRPNLEQGAAARGTDQRGIVPNSQARHDGVEEATAEDARLLGVKRGAPLLVERRLITDQAETPLELTESRYAGGRYGIDVDFVVIR